MKHKFHFFLKSHKACALPDPVASLPAFLAHKPKPVLASLAFPLADLTPKAIRLLCQVPSRY